MPALLSSPFSDDRHFATKEMSIISFAKLVNQDVQERGRLLEAAQKDGFFYLDLLEDKSEELWETYEKCLSIVARWFEQPLGEKAQYAFNSDVNGYKYLGSQAGPLENTKDGFETLRISLTALISAATVQDMPKTVLENAVIMAEFMNVSKFHVRVLLSAFSDAHGLKGAARSVSTLNVGHNKHTDAGSLTVLFASQWGLQVQSSSQKDNWEWVRPRHGYAICNVGDSLRFLSGMSLRSVIHRVVPSVDQEKGHRYSVGWFCRPSHDTTFWDSGGRMIKSNDWFAQKFEVMRGSHAEQRKNTLLTGGMELLSQRTEIEVAIKA